MKAIAVTPKQANTVRLVEMDKPSIDSIPGGRGVLVEVLRVGACGTDREISHGEYGVAPPGFDFLVLGHENLGRVVKTGENVKEFQKGDYVVATVRRPGKSFTIRSVNRTSPPTTNISSGASPGSTDIWRSFMLRAPIFL